MANEENDEIKLNSSQELSGKMQDALKRTMDAEAENYAKRVNMWRKQQHSENSLGGSNLSFRGNKSAVPSVKHVYPDAKKQEGRFEVENPMYKEDNGLEGNSKKKKGRINPKPGKGYNPNNPY